MDIEQPATEEVIDRKDLLAHQFDAAEAETNLQADTGRDEQGRYASPAPAAAEPVEQAPDDPYREPPGSWRKEYKETWGAIDPKMREYVHQREEQMRKGVEPLLSKAQFADSMHEAISPYMQTLNGMSIKPAEAVGALLQADHTLRNSPPDQKLQYFMHLAQSYGINLNQAVQGQPMQQQNTDPRLYALQNELNNVRGEINGWKQEQDIIASAKVEQEINGFMQTVDHFEELRPSMIKIIESGQAQTLEDAYDQALWSNRDLRGTMLGALQAEKASQISEEKNRAVKVARAAAVSVRSSTPGANTAIKANSRRAMLEDQFEEQSSRF